jgi:hypothetical protein
VDDRLLFRGRAYGQVKEVISLIKENKHFRAIQAQAEALKNRSADADVLLFNLRRLFTRKQLDAAAEAGVFDKPDELWDVIDARLVESAFVKTPAAKRKATSPLQGNGKKPATDGEPPESKSEDEDEEETAVSLMEQVVARGAVAVYTYLKQSGFFDHGVLSLVDTPTSVGIFARDDAGNTRMLLEEPISVEDLDLVTTAIGKRAEGQRLAASIDKAKAKIEERLSTIQKLQEEVADLRARVEQETEQKHAAEVPVAKLISEFLKVA